MTTSERPRTAAGTPAGGEFTSRERSEAEVHLAPRAGEIIGSMTLADGALSARAAKTAVKKIGARR